MSLSQFIRNGISTCVGVCFIWSTTIDAKIVELTEARNLRDVDSSTHAELPLKLIGRLNAGSLVEIPDEYCVFKNGKFNFDESVKKWMLQMTDKAGKKPVLAKFNEKQKDFFIPIQVSHAVAGSKVKTDDHYSADIPKDKTYYISIRNVAVEVDSALKTKTAADIYITPQRAIASLEAKVVEQCDNCPPMDPGLKELHTQAVTLSQNVANIQDAIAKPKLVTPKPEQSPLTLSKRDLNSTFIAKSSFAKIINKFSSADTEMRKTCGFGLDQFVPEIENQVRDTPFTSSQLLAIMTHESSGNCFPTSKDIRDPMEHGLFGITDSDHQISKNEGFCSSTAMRQSLKKAVSSSDAFNRLCSQQDPSVQCVGNPCLNLHASTRNLAAKLNFLRSKNPKQAVLDSNGKLTFSTCKKVLELYAGQGMSKYAKSACSDSVGLDAVIQMNNNLAQNSL